jgi:hypothetical protein
VALFVAPASGQILINNFYQIDAIAVYSGTCGSLNLLQCFPVDTDNNNNDICQSVQMNGLVAGNTYYIQSVTNSVQSNAGFWLYDLAAGSANDLCSGAIPISLGAVNGCPSGQIAGTTVNARHNTNFECADQYQCNYFDVWYSFTAPASGAVKFTPGTGNPIAAIYSGSCNSLQPAGCYNGCGEGIFYVTSGETYYMAVALYEEQNMGQSFTFCLDEAPAPSTNNDCSGATAIAVSPTGNCSNTSGTTVGASLSTPFPCSFGSSEQYLDVWYSFTAPAGGKVTFRSGSGNPFAVIRSGSCNNNTVVSNGCMRGSGTVSGLSSGATYYLQVLTSGCSGTAFDFCLEVSGSAPANNNCNNATPVSLNSPITINSIYAVTTQLPPCAPLPVLNAPDLWFSFSGPSNGALGVAMSGGLLPTTIFSGSCGNLNTVACAIPLAGSPPNNLTPGQTYYAMVSSLGATANGTVTLSGTPPCTPTDWYADADGDGYGTGPATNTCTPPGGYAANNGDCNETSAAINPGATEVCNGTDDDCDSGIDEGVTNTYYQDNDGDLKGNPNVQIQACSQPIGYVSNSLDCDDNSATACPKPSALMTTNITNNSATVSWNNLICATKYRLEYRRKSAPISAWTVVYTTSPTYNITGLTGPNIQYQWRVATICSPNGTAAESGYATPIQSFRTHYITYPDSDNDGQGAAGSQVVFVHPYPQSGYSLNANDCDDNVPTTFLGAPELCNSVDDDCDTVVDEGANWYQDSDSDGLGNAAVTQNSCLQPVGYVLNSLDCDDNTTVASCSSPTGVIVNNIGINLATINWNSVSCASGYNTMYKNNSTGVWSASVTTTNNSYQFTGLNANTSYLARVRSKCPAPNTVTTSAWVYYTFTTNASGLIEEVSDQVITTLDPLNFGIYPNPGSGRFTITTTNETDGVADITVLDGFGKLIRSVRWSVFEGITVNELDLTDLPGGVYHINLRQGELIQTKKVVILK